MSPGDVLSAEQSENNSAAVVAVVAVATVAEAPDSEETCTLLYVPLAARAPKYPSSPETGDQCTALTATLRRDGRDKGSKLAFAPPKKST
jgi:hypothetical protein